MTIADLTRARVFANSTATGEAADWIHSLADEVEALQRALRMAHDSEQAALADAARLTEENQILRTALSELLENVGGLLKAVTL